MKKLLKSEIYRSHKQYTDAQTDEKWLKSQKYIVTVYKQ